MEADWMVLRRGDIEICYRKIEETSWRAGGEPVRIEKKQKLCVSTRAYYPGHEGSTVVYIA